MYKIVHKSEKIVIIVKSTEAKSNPGHKNNDFIYTQFGHRNNDFIVWTVWTARTFGLPKNAPPGQVRRPAAGRIVKVCTKPP